MEKRNCLNCGDPIPPDKRSDSKFCSNSCKAKHWEKNRNQPRINFSGLKLQAPQKQINPLEGLRGIIDANSQSVVPDTKQTSKPTVYTPNTRPILVPVFDKIETPAYKEAKAKKEPKGAELKESKEVQEVEIDSKEQSFPAHEVPDREAFGPET